MSIGAGIFLIALGAILAFAVRDQGGTLDLTVAGVVIMLAGATGIWLSYHITNKRRRVTTPAVDAAVEEEYRAVHEPSGTQEATPRRSPGIARPPASAPVPTAPPSVTSPPEYQVPAQAAATAPEEPSSVERHVELDPAASGLPTSVPDRAAPPSVGRRDVPVPPPATGRTVAGGSWGARLARRFGLRR